MVDTKGKRPWRKPESYKAEKLMRNLVKPFLESRGYTDVEDKRKKMGGGESQTIRARGPNGELVHFRVRSCWRWGAGGREPWTISASQLTARYVDSFEATLDNVIRRNLKADITDLLLVQSDGNEIVYAASIPVPELRRLWEKQRDVSNAVIQAGQMGRVKKNHAENGDSPTLWLMDSRAPGGKTVADVLWNWPGVIDVVNLPMNMARVNDTYDDLPETDDSLYGGENAPRKTTSRSQVKRDPAVRRKVVARAVDGCEMPGCADTRTYSGFLDVHHVLSVEKSDRVWTCVALCPNCHREAHFAENSEHLNQQLLEYARQFAPKQVTHP
ncbi:hypothetical protein PMI15_04318 [Polaromonas sp. CF318]|uniref:HNH endonuclease signature motif containing protein n=1 Tax=Polaromonas sp. CF318 TaxID=1144318 RepID=UPI000270FA15|nr:HNH endonuclease signature motif containing protein [Polaromonas sp. CF318]EJL78469.1 hypothetical protein PMI15_04318 [Polaromonas sp. CF318]